MRALWITTFPPRQCGIGDYASDLAREMIRNGGLDLRVLTYADGVTQESPGRGGIEIDRALRPKPTAPELKARVEQFEPDLVHLQSSSFLHRPAVNRAVRRATAVPLVTTAHDVPRSWRVFYVIPSLRGIYRKSARIIVHSRRVRQVLEGFHHVDPEKITQMPHGVDTHVYRPDAETPDTRKQVGLQGKRIVLFFGFLRPGKGLETLLRAWSRIHPLPSDAILVLAGGTPSGARRYGFLAKDEASYPQELRRTARDLNVGSSTVFTGYVSEGVVPGLLAAAEIIVLPYDSNEAQSGPFHKALSSGRPVVATAVPGFQDLVEDGKQAMLVPPGDEAALARSISAILDDPALGRRLGHAGRALAERTLDLSVVAAATARLYEEILAA